MDQSRLSQFTIKKKFLMGLLQRHKNQSAGIVYKVVKTAERTVTPPELLYTVLAGREQKYQHSSSPGWLISRTDAKNGLMHW